MWSFHIHSKKRIFLFFAIIVFIFYIWHYSMVNVREFQLKLHHSLPVNFKHLVIACVLAAQKGGSEIKKSLTRNLNIKVKGKTKEGVLDIVTSGDKLSNLVMVNSLSYTFPGLKIISEENISFDREPIVLDIKNHLMDSDFSVIPDDILLNTENLQVWIDPLDATKELSEGLTQYVTNMVCISRNNEPIIGIIHQPFQSRTYWASKFGVDKKLLNLKLLPNSNNSLKIIISRSHKGHIDHTLGKNLNFTIMEAAGSGYKTLQLINGKADIYLHNTFIKKWDICAPDALIKYATDGILTTLKGRSIDYGFETDVVNREGLFVTAKSELIKIRDIII